MPLRQALGGTAPVLIWRVVTSVITYAQAKQQKQAATGSVQKALSSFDIRIVRSNVLGFLKQQSAFSDASNRIQISQSSM